LGDKILLNFGNFGVEDSAPVTLGQLVALMAVMVIKVFWKNLLIILNLSASQILPMLISGILSRGRKTVVRWYSLIEH